MKNTDEVDYSLYDTNGDRYNIKVSKRDAAKFDVDHMATYRCLQKLKREGQRPAKSEDPAFAELRSPSSKKPKAQDLVYSSFAPKFESTHVDINENGNDTDPQQTKKAVRSLNRSFDLSLILTDNDEDEVVEVPTTVKQSLWTHKLACHTFLNQLGKNIEELQKKRKKAVFEKISTAMEADGFYFSADALYEKKRGLDAQYCKYKKKDRETQAKWEYFAAMEHISNGRWPAGFKSQPKTDLSSEGTAFDEAVVSYVAASNEGFDDGAHGEVHEVDCDIHLEKTQVSGEDGFNESGFDDGAYGGFDDNDRDIPLNRTQVNEDVGEKSKEWGTQESDKALLEEVTECKDDFVDCPLVKNVNLFKEVSKRLERRSYKVSGPIAMTRYNALIRRFHAENDKLKNTGEGQCKWNLFDMIYDLEKGSVTTKSLVTVSAGAANNISKAYECIDNLKAGRLRAPNPTRQQRVKKLMGPEPPSGTLGLKNRQLEIQERRLNMEMEYLEEFRGFRQDANRRAENFMKGIALLKELKDKNNNN